MSKSLCFAASLALLACLAFCAFGFLATFEPLPPATQWLWRGIYFVAAGVSLAVLARLWRTPRRAARR